MIGTANTVRRDCRPSHRFDLGRSSSPTNTVASSANRMPVLISDARTGNNCGGHTAGRLAAQAQLGRTGCAIQSTNNPRSTVPTATAGERVAPTVWMGIEPDYRSSTTAARRLRRLILRDSVNQSRRGFRLRAPSDQGAAWLARCNPHTGGVSQPQCVETHGFRDAVARSGGAWPSPQHGLRRGDAKAGHHQRADSCCSCLRLCLAASFVDEAEEGA